jgi:hypothetical protein
MSNAPQIDVEESFDEIESIEILRKTIALHGTSPIYNYYELKIPYFISTFYPLSNEQKQKFKKIYFSNLERLQKFFNERFHQ